MTTQPSVSQTYLIRPAVPEDAPAAAELIAMSLGGMGDALCGLGEHARQLRALEALFRRRGSRFSHGLVHLAAQDGQTVGLLLAYPGAQQVALNLGMFFQMWSIYGLAGGLRFTSLALRLAAYKEVEPGELLVSNLAVLPPFWGQGIARSLLRRAEELAQGLGIRRMTLMVDMDNPRARNLYERTGYRLDLAHRTPHLASRLHTNGFDRMVKVLAG